MGMTRGGRQGAQNVAERTRRGGSVRCKPLLQHRVNALACRAVSTNPTAAHLAQHLQRVVGDKGLPPQLINRVAAHGGRVASSGSRSAGVQRAGSRGDRGLLSSLSSGKRVRDRASAAAWIECQRQPPKAMSRSRLPFRPCHPLPHPLMRSRVMPQAKGWLGLVTASSYLQGGERSWWRSWLESRLG